MIEVVSLVNFSNKKRVKYLDKSFSSFYSFNHSKIRHIVLDSSEEVEEQRKIYDKYGIEFHHFPKSSYLARLKMINEIVKNDYFVFLPDDFVWIMDFPLDKAIEAAASSRLAQLKLSCRGMTWFAEKNPAPKSWFDGRRLESGEKLVVDGNCFVSKRWWYRNFHEQFSLAATITQKQFLNSLVGNMSGEVFSPGAVEKKAYVKLLLRSYYTGYYKMWIPAFHFCDPDVEGEEKDYTTKDMLIEENYKIYNKFINRIS